MRVLRRILVASSLVAASLGPVAPARAESCDYKTQDGVEYLYCRTVGGCIASGPEAIDPVVCD
jgi:hypothetical protein